MPQPPEYLGGISFHQHSPRHSGREQRLAPRFRGKGLGFRLDVVVKRVGSVPKNYDWGTPDALSLLRGTAPSGQPEAEIWFGPHPLGQCTIDDGGEVPFDQWLTRTGHEFPLLVKFLAASKPLSIQVHPSADVAKEGFHREEAEGLEPEHPRRTFKDPSAKPEQLVCLSEFFDVLWGLQTPSGLVQKFGSWLAAGLPARAEHELRRLAALPPELALKDMMIGANSLSELVEDLAAWGLEYVGQGTPTPTELERHVCHKIATHFPGDAGIVVAAFMHARRLVRGESIFVTPGEMHAYVEGFGLEVMLPSDNVVRAGLTGKHRDAELFLSVATLVATDSVPTVSPSDDGASALPSPESFPWELRSLGPGSVLEATRDSMVVVEKAPLALSGVGHSQALDPGYGYFVAAGERLPALSGDGVAWQVIPLPNSL